MSQHSSRGAAWNKLRLAVLDRDGWVCAYCGKHLVGSDATVDHLISKASGGSDAMWNLVSACRKDNGTKQDRVLVRLTGFNPTWLERAV